MPPRVRILFRTETRGGSAWRGLVSRMVRHTLAVAEYVQPCEVSVLMTDDDAIRSLNREYRNLDSATDVLSFSMLEGEPQPGSDLLGDLVISVETATRRAGAHGVPLEAEMALLVAHGVLHLLGYDHHAPAPRRRMRVKEGAALQRAGIDPAVVGRPV